MIVHASFIGNRHTVLDPAAIVTFGLSRPGNVLATARSDARQTPLSIDPIELISTPWEDDRFDPLFPCKEVAMRSYRALDFSRENAVEPLFLLVPGLENIGHDHWQSHWETDLGDARRVHFASCDYPLRDLWVDRLNVAIREAGRPVVLIAHSLGCHAVAWWSQREQPTADSPVVAALLVAPPNVEGVQVDHQFQQFGPTAQKRLPFPSFLVASRDDPHATMGQAKRMARKWGSRLLSAGWLGHLDARSAIGNWPYGRFLLQKLLSTSDLDHNVHLMSPQSGTQSYGFAETCRTA